MAEADGKEKTVKVDKEKEKKERWAIQVDISSPVDNFYKLIPDPAYKVCYNFYTLFLPLFGLVVRAARWHASDPGSIL
jgi:hypothetical protein